MFVKNFSTGPTWLPGVITECRGPLSFQVRLEDDRIVRRPIDHVRCRFVDSPGTSVELDLPGITIPGANPVDDDPPIKPMPRRSTRMHRPPDRFMPDLH